MGHKLFNENWMQIMVEPTDSIHISNYMCQRIRQMKLQVRRKNDRNRCKAWYLFEFWGSWERTPIINEIIHENYNNKKLVLEIYAFDSYI